MLLLVSFTVSLPLAGGQCEELHGVHAVAPPTPDIRFLKKEKYVSDCATGSRDTLTVSHSQMKLERPLVLHPETK